MKIWFKGKLYETKIGNFLYLIHSHAHWGYYLIYNKENGTYNISNNKNGKLYNSGEEACPSFVNGAIKDGTWQSVTEQEAIEYAKLITN